MVIGAYPDAHQAVAVRPKTSRARRISLLRALDQHNMESAARQRARPGRPEYLPLVRDAPEEGLSEVFRDGPVRPDPVLFFDVRRKGVRSCPRNPRRS